MSGAICTVGPDCGIATLPAADRRAYPLLSLRSPKAWTEDCLLTRCRCLYSWTGAHSPIRTPDILLPKQARYQAALHSVGVFLQPRRPLGKGRSPSAASGKRVGSGTGEAGPWPLPRHLS